MQYPLTVYIVQPGDTLWGICRALDVDFTLTRNINKHIMDADVIRVGDGVLIPAAIQDTTTPPPVTTPPPPPPPVTVTPPQWPDATNTGPSGTLTPFNGTYTVTTNNAVVQNLHITGRLIIQASNVTVRNCKITNTTNRYVVEIKSGSSGILIEDCEVDGNDYSTHGVVHGGYTMRRCNVHNCGDGLRGGSNTLIEDTYVHTLKHNLLLEPAPHYDCYQTLGGANQVIRNCRFMGRYRGQTSAIIMENLFGRISITVEGCYLSGGAYTFGMMTGKPYPYGTVIIRNNTFQRHSSQYGPLGHYDGPYPIKADAPGTWANNVFDTGGAVYPGMGYDRPPG